jgi:predicted MPP superfamily phosphohydrolase
VKKKRIFLALLGVGLLLGLWAFWWEPDSLRVREYHLAIPSWPAEYGPIKIALIGDLHAGAPYMNEDKLRRIVQMTNAEHPDLILLPGDFVIQSVAGGRFMPPETTAGILKQLHAPLGVFAVLGNHDWWLDGPRVTVAFERAGIPVLENRILRITFHDKPIQLMGVGDSFSGHDRLLTAMHDAVDGPPLIAFTHNPDLFTEIQARVAVTLAAHTHGGQVNLPFAGRLIVPSRYGSRFAVGHIVEEGRHLFVTPGVGTSIIPVRFRVPPEISLVDISPVPK